MTRLYCGIPAELEPQTAFLEMIPDPPVVLAPPPNGVAHCMEPLHAWMNRPEGRRTPQPGCSGIMSARSVARHYAALLPGGVDGVELLPPSRVRLAVQEQAPTGGYDEGTGPRGLGYGLGDGGSSTAFGHGGYGGSAGYANPPYRLAVGVTRNRFSDNDLSGMVAGELRSALGIS
jgi:CubicO group peptidase (beta-lactamase class C family)